MRVLSYAVDGKVQLGVLLSGERVLDVTNVYPTALAFLDAGDAGMAALRAAADRAEKGEALAGQVRPLDSLSLRAPVPQCRKLLALAGNYREHIREGGRPTYAKEETYPYFFMKPATTGLVGSGTAIQHPRISQTLDYEGEFVIVIGRRGKHVTVDNAMDYVAGYTILNDISERKLDSKQPPKVEREMNRFFDWLVGKWMDTGAPCGPWLVTKDEVPDPHALALRTRVNGETRQDSSTAEMIFTVPEILAFISRVLTLEPGDMIATGTPAGVGSARGVFLKPGDTVEVEIERLGVLRNPIVPEG
jgi:2-keto-4-pentenoate hydratase/2-oxohepta-3-ene-1,7-dioic acid hydratase in catechol pathway